MTLLFHGNDSVKILNRLFFSPFEQLIANRNNNDVLCENRLRNFRVFSIINDAYILAHYFNFPIPRITGHICCLFCKLRNREKTDKISLFPWKNLNLAKM